MTHTVTFQRKERWRRAAFLCQSWLGCYVVFHRSPLSFLTGILEANHFFLQLPWKFRHHWGVYLVLPSLCESHLMLLNLTSQSNTVFIFLPLECHWKLLLMAWRSQKKKIKSLHHMYSNYVSMNSSSWSIVSSTLQTSVEVLRSNAVCGVSGCVHKICSCVWTFVKRKTGPNWPNGYKLWLVRRENQHGTHMLSFQAGDSVGTVQFRFFLTSVEVWSIFDCVWMCVVVWLDCCRCILPSQMRTGGPVGTVRGTWEPQS